MDDRLTSVVIEDAYIRVHHQILNFVRFCEILVQKAKNLKRITLITKDDVDERAFNGLRGSLAERGVDLLVNFKSQMHDREIVFNNDWIIKIGRGLDYFKPIDDKYALGACDYSMRRCRETTVDIYKVKPRIN
uniref:MIT_C domain-containing protein n=1 Tax=Steinernema glaseri TaxID=37863 RepID=A0A1I8A1M4_9BILA